MMLRHLVFFSALADGGAEGIEPPEILAALLVLRWVDLWITGGESCAVPDAQGVGVARMAILAEGVSSDARQLLLSIVNAIQASEYVDLEPVFPRLFAYATLLERRGAFALAADVHELIVERSNDEAPDQMATDAATALGYCRYKCADLDAATRAYRSAARFAGYRHDIAAKLRARIGVATVVRLRGNLPRANELLAVVVGEARAAALPIAEGCALQEQAIVAKHAGDPERAIALGVEALQLLHGTERERGLVNLSAALIEAGRFDAARDALLIHEATGVHIEGRRVARLNLLAIGARTHDRAAFDRYRALLANETLTPEFRVNYLVESARGMRAFGAGHEAMVLLEEARALAEHHGLNRVAFEAAGMLDTSPPSTPVSRMVQRAERELRRMAQAAGV